MARRCRYWLLLLGVLLTSCQRAQRYPAEVKLPAEKIEAKEPEPDASQHRLSWHEPKERHDFRLLFVPDTSPEWAQLKDYWNAQPAHAGTLTTHLGLPPLHQPAHVGTLTTQLGLPPLQALAALAFAEHHAAIKIKVPRGLPDPTGLIPNSNPPTLGKWLLGKKLFHAPHLQAGADVYSCASCHNPNVGFTESNKLCSDGGDYNTLSLINVAYNRRQFWDGRVGTLEETLVRGLAGEADVDPARGRERALVQHNWTGYVRILGEVKSIKDDFKRVFGVDHPTQDTAAQALATYLRTILAGDSLFDRAADPVRKEKNVRALTEKDFLALLDLKDAGGKDLAVLQDEPTKKLTAENLKAIARGYELFHGKAGCATCHSGPLFTDRDYHNIGVDPPEKWPKVGKETGRAVHVPVGRKEGRLIGAYRTPTLRNLAKTGPYFHDGKKFSIEEVVKYYDEGALPTPHLARALHDRGKLELEKNEPEALVMFLRALEGAPVDPIVTAHPR